MVLGKEPNVVADLPQPSSVRESDEEEDRRDQSRGERLQRPLGTFFAFQRLAVGQPRFTYTEIFYASERGGTTRKVRKCQWRKTT